MTRSQSQEPVSHTQPPFSAHAPLFMNFVVPLEVQPPVCGDANCDDIVDAVDALFVLQHVVGLRPELCVCPAS